MFPIRQSLGAWTAAEHGAEFFKNVVSEHSANPRMLIIHECMGRDCGYLTAATAYRYRELLYKHAFVLYTPAHKDVHAIYLPESKLDIDGYVAMQAKELNNGRLAMIGVAGMTAQELVTDTPIFA